jgi:multisubunit Na+/H+ antiporter MnhG subunit
MIDFPTSVAGTVTIVALIGLGIFVYPWLLKRKDGVGVIGALTVLLAFLFYAFDSSRSEPIATSAGLALLWALAPVLAGVIVHRLGRRGNAAEPLR